jgi:hypothetical protein
VDNEGLASFFCTAGFYSRDLEESLRLLGVDDMLDAVLEGLRILTRGGEVPADGELRKELWYNLSDPETDLLNSVDLNLYQGSSVENRLFPYFKKYDSHPQEFFRE